MLQPGQLVRVNLAGLQAEGVLTASRSCLQLFQAAVTDVFAIVNGSWAPPILGWTNYLAVYQQQRARMQQVRMDRSNTYIKVSGTVAWASYQWDFEAVVDGQQTASQGQTTVVLEKRNNHWVIVLNHTSLPPRVSQPSTAPSAQQQPAKPSWP